MSLHKELELVAEGYTVMIIESHYGTRMVPGAAQIVADGLERKKSIAAARAELRVVTCRPDKLELRSQVHDIFAALFDKLLARWGMA